MSARQCLCFHISEEHIDFRRADFRRAYRLHISVEHIDYQEVVQHVDGPPTEKNELLCGYEELKLYPPRLSHFK